MHVQFFPNGCVAYLQFTMKTRVYCSLVYLFIFKFILGSKNSVTTFGKVCKERTWCDNPLLCSFITLYHYHFYLYLKRSTAPRRAADFLSAVFIFAETFPFQTDEGRWSGVEGALAVVICSSPWLKAKRFISSESGSGSELSRLSNHLRAFVKKLSLSLSVLF